MRLISVGRLPEGARLAEAVWSSAHGRIHPLLASGTAVSDAMRAALARNGIDAVWIEDEMSEGVAETAALPPEVRERATSELAAMFESGARAGDAARIEGASYERIAGVVEDILAAVRGSGAMVRALVDGCAADARIVSHGILTCLAGLAVGERVMTEVGWTDWKGTVRRTPDHERLVQLGLGLVLHDIGLAGMPSELLELDHLGPAERLLVADHPRRGIEVLVRCDISPIAKVVVSDHHERLDGSGYPAGKAGGRLHQHARIAAVADVYQGACSGVEPGSAARTTSEAWALVVKGASQGALDPAIAAVFTKVVAPYPEGVSVALTDGRSGIVAAIPGKDLARPRVRVTHEPDVGAVAPYEVDLDGLPGVAVARQVGDPGEGSTLPRAERLAGMA